MTNWIGIAIWLLLGACIGLAMKLIVNLDEETSGHTLLLAILGAFGALVGGMMGVGFFSFWEPSALSVGGLLGAVALSTLISFLYRWGARSMV